MSEYRPSYTDRIIRPAVLVAGEGHAKDALDDVIYSMGAITMMMRGLLNEGEDIRHLSEHVYRLLDQQCCMLAGVYEELSKEEDERRDAAVDAGVLRQRNAPSDALNDPAYKLRLEFIESKAKAGVDAGLIGAALNIHRDDIERVVSQLRGATTGAQGGKAVGALRRASAQA